MNRYLRNGMISTSALIPVLGCSTKYLNGNAPQFDILEASRESNSKGRQVVVDAFVISDKGLSRLEIVVDGKRKVKWCDGAQECMQSALIKPRFYHPPSNVIVKAVDKEGNSVTETKRVY